MKDEFNLSTLLAIVQIDMKIYKLINNKLPNI